MLRRLPSQYPVCIISVGSVIMIVSPLNWCLSLNYRMVAHSTGYVACMAACPMIFFSLAGRAIQILTGDRHISSAANAARQPGGPRRARPRLPALWSHRLSTPVTRRDCTDHPWRRGAPGARLRFPGNFYSTPAGFVEPGESLEQAVERELAEELSIKVRDIRYFGSQPWPYPHQLMIGFTCTWDSVTLSSTPRNLPTPAGSRVTTCLTCRRP